MMSDFPMKLAATLVAVAIVLAVLIAIAQLVHLINPG